MVHTPEDRIEQNRDAPKEQANTIKLFTTLKYDVSRFSELISARRRKPSFCLKRHVCCFSRRRGTGGKMTIRFGCRINLITSVELFRPVCFHHFLLKKNELVEELAAKPGTAPPLFRSSSSVTSRLLGCIATRMPFLYRKRGKR